MWGVSKQWDQLSSHLKTCRICRELSQCLEPKPASQWYTGYLLRVTVISQSHFDLSTEERQCNPPEELFTNLFLVNGLICSIVTQTYTRSDVPDNPHKSQVQMTQYLPPELTDRVVDHLHDDSRALSSCALASRILLSAARYHQFGTIILNSDRITLFNALLDKDPSLGYSVSKILLASRFWTHLWHPDANELRIAIERTPACRHIEIWHIQFLENSQVISQLIAGTKNLQIESLRIYDVHFFCGFDELPWLISSLPYLQDLTLDSICSKDTGEDSSKHWEVYKPPSRLTALTTGTINENGVHNICSWLGKAKPSFVLHSYNLEIVDYSSAYFGTQVLTHFGQTISNLSVKVDCDLNVPYVLEKVGLTVENCPSLRHLHISFHLRDMFVKENQSLQWITILISQISSPIIEAITITIYADEVQFHDLRALDSECGVRELLLVKFEDMAALNWEVINDILLSEKFRSLSRLSLKGRGPWDTFKAYIESYYQSIAHLVVLYTSDS